MPHGLSELLLRLYRLAREAQAPVFKDQAFALVREYLPFQSGLWGAMTVYSPDRTTVHWVHLDHQTLEMIANWQKYSAHDASHAEAIEILGRTIVVNLSRRKEAVRYHPRLIEHGHTYDICHALSTVTFDPVLNVRNAISFYRGWKAKPFTETERRLKQDLVPHLAEAWNICMIRFVDTAPDLPGGARALVDGVGAIHNAEPGFTDLLRIEFPEWLGPGLPPALAQTSAAPRSEVFRGRKIVALHLTRMDDGMRLIGLKQAGAEGQLSPREMAVAREFAAGRTHTEIAGRFGVAPKTVRNQLQSVYAKLDVKTKVALLKRLDEKA